MRSLRTRLFASVLGGAAGVVLVAGVTLTATIGRWLEREFDRALLARVRALVALTEQLAGRIEMDVEAERMPEFQPSASAEYFELRSADGTLLARSPSFELDDATRRGTLVRAPEPAPAPVFEDLRLPDGRRGRQVRVDFVPVLDVVDDAGEVSGAPAGDPAGSPAPTALLAATLVVARERQGLDGTLRWLTAAVVGVGAGLLVALAGLTHLALRVGLRSLDRLGGQVRALDVASLGTRIDVPSPPAEIAVVVDQVNALLDRLEAGFRRERRLSSDMAHELRTPITELRTLCEVGGRWPDDRAAVRAFFEDARAIALQMERIAVNLIALARCDEGREPVTAAPVGVADAVEAAWTAVAREAATRRITLRRAIAPTHCLLTDPDKFALIVANLLSNAVAHSPPGTTVDAASAVANGHVSLTVSNRTESLEPGDLSLMFDRFWRKDEARAGGRHAGLGLSLVRALADLLGIGIETRLDPDRTFRITLSHPAGPGCAGPTV